MFNADDAPRDGVLHPPAASAADVAGQGPTHGPTGVAVTRVTRAFDQVADQLKGLILRGDLPSGTRLPRETALAREFGVSRTTIREALRMLAGDGLISTTRGTGGGSVVTRPTLAHIGRYLQSNLALLTRANNVTLEEFLEVRELIEVPAVGLAAVRRSEEDLARLWSTVPDQNETFAGPHAHNRSFHDILLEASGNRLLCVTVTPIYSVLQTHLEPALPYESVVAINEYHRQIAQAIEARDPDAATHHMKEHLDFLRPYYERVWKYAVQPPSLTSVAAPQTKEVSSDSSSLSSD